MILRNGCLPVSTATLSLSSFAALDIRDYSSIAA
jgi:hypothetical protein